MTSHWITSSIHYDTFFLFQVFFSHAALLAITNIIFCIIGSGQPASWAASNSWNEKETKKMVLTDPIDFNEAEAGIIELNVIRPKGK